MKRRVLALACVASTAAALAACALVSGASDLTIADPDAASAGDGAAEGAPATDATSIVDAPPDRAIPRKVCDEPGLVARWTLDETSGDDILDCTSFRHDGRNDGGIRTLGERDGGLAFDGGWVGFGNPASLQITGPLSACAWIRPASIPAADPARGYVIGKLTNPNGGGWRLAVSPGTGRDTGAISINVPDGDGGLGETRGGVISTGAWQHVCCVYQPGGQSVWVDGKQVANDTTPFAKITLTNDELRIGARADGTNAYAGVVDDVRMYARALSDAEIVALAQP